MAHSSFRSAVAAVLIGAAAMPAAAQTFSDSYTFLKAVRENDGNKVNDLLDGASGPTLVDTRDRSTGDTALHIVARQRNSTWLNFLLGKGANANARNEAGDTPLIVAARIGFTEGVQALIARRATVDLANQSGETPLILATQNRDASTARLLLAAGADPDRTDSTAGMSARDYARRDGRSAVILRLMDTARETATPRDNRPVAGPN